MIVRGRTADSSHEQVVTSVFCFIVVDRLHTTDVLAGWLFIFVVAMTLCTCRGD